MRIRQGLRQHRIEVPFERLPSPLGLGGERFRIVRHDGQRHGRGIDALRLQVSVGVQPKDPVLTQGHPGRLVNSLFTLSLACGVTVGDTTLYCFDPLSGALANCLIYMSGPYAGRNTAVVHMGSVGIPSDLLVVNNNMYFATSTGGLTRQTIRQTPPAGDVRSYRRLR